jgi:hypothetical protein
MPEAPLRVTAGTVRFEFGIRYRRPQSAFVPSAAMLRPCRTSPAFHVDRCAAVEQKFGA